MSNDPVEPGVDADDLLGRWLAHHDQPADDGAAPSPRRVPIAARPSAAAVPRTRLSAAAALAELREATTVDLRDGLGPVAPPSTFGARRGQPGSGDVAELDRPSPVGFEPVLLRSVRKKSEPKEEPEKDKRRRLSRLRSRVAGPVEEAASPEPPTVEAPPVSLYDAPVAHVPPPVFTTPPPAAEPVVPTPPRPVVPYEDVVALSVAASLPYIEPPPVALDPVPEPITEPITEPVLPGPDTPPAPQGRLSRLRSRAAGPVEAAASSEAPTVEAPPVSLYDAPVAPTPPRPVVPFEDVVALSVAASHPDIEPPPVALDPAPEPITETITEPVLPGPDTPPAPLSVLPEQKDDGEEPDVPTITSPAADPATDPATDAEAPTKRRLVARTRAPETEEPEERKRRPRVARSAPGTGTAGAARGLLAAARAATPATPAPAPAVPEVAKVPLLPVEQPVETVPSAPAMEMPSVYEFAPRKSSRRFLTMMLVAGLVMSGYLGYAAYQSRDTAAIGLAAIVTLVTLVIWAIRAGATVTRLTVRRGQLEIVRQGGRMVFDLASTYTAIEVVGKPGSKKWRVNFLRRGMSPVTVDATMVDGRDFMRILSFFRPELAAS